MYLVFTLLLDAVCTLPALETETYLGFLRLLGLIALIVACLLRPLGGLSGRTVGRVSARALLRGRSVARAN